MRVAAVQMQVSGDVGENLQRQLAFIAAAKERGADVVCFPETSLQSDEEDVRRITSAAARVRAAAREQGINVIFGTYNLDAKRRIRNQVWVVDRNGDVVARYNKRNPYLTERAFLTAGRRNKVFLLDGVRMGVINCWDYAFPEHIRSLARKGAQVIFCPSYLLSHPQTASVLAHVPQVRAFDAMCYFVMVDAATKETFRRSKICHPLRELARIEEEEGLITADLDLAEIDALRERFQNL